MADRPSADRTAEVLLWYRRQPSRYSAEGRRRDGPKVNAEVVLRLALGRPLEFAGSALNDPSKAHALRKAAVSYVRHMFFRPDATPYQTLGLEPGASYQAIKENFRLLMHLVHPDRQDGRDRWPESCAAQANQAYSMLRDKDSRRTFEEEAQARAALARAIHRAAAAAEASRMPTVVWPTTRRKGAPPLPRPTLPEWLTAGVGGYVREHPATTAFAVLIAGALSIVGATLWEGREDSLIRVAREAPVPATRVGSQAAAAPVAVADAPAVAAPEPVPARRGNPDAETRIVLASTAPGIPIASAPEERVRAPMPAATREPAPANPPIPAADPADSRGEPPGRAEQVALVNAPAASTLAPASTEIEALFATFVDTYEHGRLDAFTALFDDDADTNLRRGRAAIRGEYDELFRLSQWRRMQLTRINWRRVGDRAVARGEITVRIGWRDGREVEQRLNVDMELMRRDGRVVIARLSHQPRIP
jgi:hypothetical protein